MVVSKNWRWNYHSWLTLWLLETWSLAPSQKDLIRQRMHQGAAELAGNRHFLHRFPFIFRHISWNVTFTARRRSLGSPGSTDTVSRCVCILLSTFFEVKLIIKKEGRLHKLRNPYLDYQCVTTVLPLIIVYLNCLQRFLLELNQWSKEEPDSSPIH